MGRVEMLDDDKGQSGVNRHLAEKLLQGLKAAGGGANSDNRQGGNFWA